MTFWVWFSLYVLVGAVIGGVYFCESNDLTPTEAPLVLIPVFFWPVILAIAILAFIFRVAQRVGRRWPRAPR